MRGSLALLVILAACSDASAPRRGLVLTTELSSASASVGEAITVTLQASNTADTTVRLSYSLPAALLEIEQNAGWADGSSYGGVAGTDTLDLTPGASAPLGTINVIFYPPSGLLSSPPAIPGNYEYFAVSPGSYPVRACYWPFWISTPVDYVPRPICGNKVAFTLTE